MAQSWFGGTLRSRRGGEGGERLAAGLRQTTGTDSRTHLSCLLGCRGYDLGFRPPGHRRSRTQLSCQSRLPTGVKQQRAGRQEDARSWRRRVEAGAGGGPGARDRTKRSGPGWTPGLDERPLRPLGGRRPGWCRDELLRLCPRPTLHLLGRGGGPVRPVAGVGSRALETRWWPGSGPSRHGLVRQVASAGALAARRDGDPSTGSSGSQPVGSGRQRSKAVTRRRGSGKYIAPR